MEKDVLKYLKSISESLKNISDIMSEENKREKEEMKMELEKEKKEKKDIEDTANEILEYLDKNPEATSKEIISSLSE